MISCRAATTTSIRYVKHAKLSGGWCAVLSQSHFPPTATQLRNIPLLLLLMLLRLLLLLQATLDNPECRLYREWCPAVACGPDGVTDHATGLCRRVRAAKK